MPIASIILHKDSKLVVSNSGFEELPAIVTRHLRWSEASAYGASPAMKALAEIRGVNYLELLMSTLAGNAVTVAGGDMGWTYDALCEFARTGARE